MDELAISALPPNENKSLALPDAEAERVAIAGWQICRELLPAQIESDQAFIVRLQFLKEIVREAGPDRFIEAIKQAIRISQYRSEVTIKRIRECAGLPVTLPKSPTVEAWELVTEVVRHYLVRDSEGNAIPCSRIAFDPDMETHRDYLLPEIPESVKRAVATIGGWTALSESYPNWWSQKFNQWKEVYRG